MRSGPVDSYRAAMRLVIDFEAEPGRWAGVILPEPEHGDAAVPARFSGRLDLLRLLEALVEGAAPNPGEPKKEPT